jgi:hypothetical protein
VTTAAAEKVLRVPSINHSLLVNEHIVACHYGL